MLSDLKFALRQLTKAPGFTVTIVLTLALGMAACVTMFSVLQATVLHDTGAEADRRLTLLRTPLRAGGDVSLISPADYFVWERELTSYEALGAHGYLYETLIGEGEPQEINGYRITSGWLDAMGVPVVLGRSFLPEENIPGNDNVVIISHALWRRVFGSADVIGRTIQLGGRPRVIVGVLSDEFKYAAPTRNFVAPLVASETERTDERLTYTVRARLKRGVSLSRAQAELDVVCARIAQAHPDTNKGVGALAAIHHRYRARSSGPVVWTLFGAVTCVLLIACANVANLLLVRATSRQREISIRTAFGATRGRIVRQLLVESLLLALAGGAAGLLLADWTIAAIRSYPPIPSMRMLTYLELDSGIVTFAVGLSVVTAFVFGLAPAWLASRVDLNEALKQGTRGSTEGNAASRLRRAFVTGEIAVTMVLLSGAGLFLRSFVHTTREDIGLIAENAWTIDVSLSSEKYRTGPQATAFVDSVIARLQAVPGVSAAGAGRLPLGIIDATGFMVEGGPTLLRAEWPRATMMRATPGYFEALGMRLLQGRAFSTRDGPSARGVVVNDVLVRQYFPNTDPIGKRIKVTDDEWREIIGVVRGMMEIGVTRVIGPQVYVPFVPRFGSNFCFIVRTDGNSPAWHSTLKQQVYAVDREQASRVTTLAQDIWETGMKSIFEFHLLSAFSIVALVIALVGIYGVVAYAVSQRKREIGIRMALGALPGDVASLVLKQGARLVAAGLGLGLLGALASGRLLESRLYQVSATDPLTLGAVAILFAIIAALACWLPARRAAKVDPVIALRAE